MFLCLCVFFCNGTATTESETYGHTLSLHDALPISVAFEIGPADARSGNDDCFALTRRRHSGRRCVLGETRRSEKRGGNREAAGADPADRKSTRLNSSH